MNLQRPKENWKVICKRNKVKVNFLTIGKMYGKMIYIIASIYI